MQAKALHYEKKCNFREPILGALPHVPAETISKTEILKTKNTMNTKIIALATVFAASFSFAQADEKAPKDSAVELPGITVEGIAAMPTLTKRHIPKVSGELVGSEVTLRFTINAKGKPTGVDSAKPLHSIQYPRDRDFAVEMINAVKHWRFEPAQGSDGESKAVNVLMPVKVVDRDDTTVVLAIFKPLSAN